MQSGLRHTQRGATFLGMVTIVAILGLAVYAGIRLVPLYLDNMAVVRVLNLTATSLQGGDVSAGAIRDALNKHWAVEYIDSAKPADIEIAKVANGIEMRAVYEAEAPFIANIYLVLKFDKTVVINTRGGE